MYPSDELEDVYTSQNPIKYAVIVASIFICTSLVFILYDVMVQRRQKMVMGAANSANAIVSSLFPATFQKRMLEDIEHRSKQNGKRELKSFLSRNTTRGDGSSGIEPLATKPIADLFPEATIMMADIVGFTAWSSVRDPSQVFTLLETVYQAFDELAR